VARENREIDRNILRAISCFKTQCNPKPGLLNRNHIQLGFLSLYLGNSAFERLNQQNYASIKFTVTFFNTFFFINGV
jgi:hypothetical protein